MGLIENRFEPNLLTTTVDKIFNWARKSSLFPAQWDPKLGIHVT